MIAYKLISGTLCEPAGICLNKITLESMWMWFAVPGLGPRRACTGPQRSGKHFRLHIHCSNWSNMQHVSQSCFSVGRSGRKVIQHVTGTLNKLTQMRLRRKWCRSDSRSRFCLPADGNSGERRPALFQRESRSPPFYLKCNIINDYMFQIITFCTETPGPYTSADSETTG